MTQQFGSHPPPHAPPRHDAAQAPHNVITDPAMSASGRRWRLIFIAVFWSTVAYAGVALMGSILTELYSQGPKIPAADATHDAGPRQRTWCIGRLIGLKNQMDRRVAQALEPGRGGGGLRPEPRMTPAGAHENPAPAGDLNALIPWETWSADWRHAVQTAQHQCGSDVRDAAVTTAFNELLALQAQYDRAIMALIEGRTVAMQRLRDSLKELRQLSAP